MTEYEFDSTDAVIKEIKDMLQKNNGEDIPANVAGRLLLTLSVANHECNRETVAEVKKLNGRLKKVEEVAEDWEKYPSLLWLLHKKTKTTVAIIVFVFIILSSFYVSGIRAVVMEWLGLPPLIP